MNTRRLPLLAAAMLAAAAPLPAATRLELLPADLSLRLHIPGVSNLCAAIAASPPGRCWNDPAMQEFLGHPNLANWLPHFGADAHQKDEIRHLQKEQFKLIQHDLALGLGHGGSTGIYVAAQCSAANYASARELDERMARLIPEAMTFLREDFQGVEMLRTTLISDRKTTNTIWQAFLHDTVLESSDRAWVEKSISRLQTQPPHDPAAPYLLQARVAGGWIRSTLEMALTPRPRPTAAGDAATNTPLFKPGDLIDALKISELQALSLTISLKDSRLQTALRIHNTRSRQGIWALLDTTPLPADLRLPYVPADALAYGANRLDLAGFWNALPAMLTQLNPALGASQQFFQGMLQQTFGVELNSDVFRHLESAYASCSRMEGAQSRTLLYWQIKNPADVAATLGRLLGDAAPLRMQLGDNFQVAEFRGHPLYTFTPAGAGGSNAWSLAVAGQYLALGDDAMLRAALRALGGKAGAGTEFYQSAAYQELLRQKPANACAYGALDLARGIREYLSGPEWRQMRQRWAKWRAQQSAGAQKWAGPDFDRMPPPEKIASFFGPLLSYSAATDDGLESITVWMTP